MAGAVVGQAASGKLTADTFLYPGGMQVVGCYPQHTSAFVGQLTTMLDTHQEVLEPNLRQTLVKALILLRNRNQVRACAARALL